MRKTSIALAATWALLGCKSSPERARDITQGEGHEAAPTNVQCGQTLCTGGQVCCNPSCGICAPPDGMCTQQFCDTPRDADGGAEALPDAPNSCSRVRCAGGTHCELVQVQCIKAPCEPVPECRPDGDAGN